MLSERTQQVVLDSQASDPVPVLSGLPQGSVLGPILFLTFINDQPDKIRSSVHLFQDDYVLYRNIYSIQDCFILQEDLTSLGQWEANWHKKFNVAKCHSLRVTRHHSGGLGWVGWGVHGVGWVGVCMGWVGWGGWGGVG